MREVLDSVVHWTVHDDRIGWRSDAFALTRDPESVVLIDPLPLDDRALAALGRIGGICLTIQSHQRSAFSAPQTVRLARLRASRLEGARGAPGRRVLGR
jgi:hypothetical protein